MAKSNYTTDSIKVLSDIDHIKQRKGMYIGEAVDARQLISEIIDNAIDEVQGGYSDKLVINIDTKEHKYTVRDFGRGIPHGKKKLEDGTEKETVEVLCTKSNSGGKFDSNSYITSVGLNGLGLTITNALSKYFQIITHRDGKYVKLVASQGKISEISRGKSKEQGTEVTFIPDSEVFQSKDIPVDFIKQRCKVSTALGYKSVLCIDGEIQDTDATMFDLISDKDSSIYCNYDEINVKIDTQEYMKCAIQYTSETTDKYYGYTNLLFNSAGGTHIQELSKAIIESWKTFIKNKKIKLDVELKPSDFLIGLRAVCAVFIINKQFSSQTKEKLITPKAYFKSLMEAFTVDFIKKLCNNVDISKALLNRFCEYRIAQNKLLARKEISSLIRVNEDNPNSIRRRSVVEKLSECTKKSRDGTELFIAEGDSAAGTLIRARNREYQAVLPLRGKILNVTNKDVKTILKSQPICNIVNSIGCGIGSQCDSTKSRYERVIISADADDDGKQIVCLVLSVFINFLPDLVKDGRLYVALPPLYGWRDKKGYHYTNNREEIPSSIAHFTRYKGLGELDDDEMWITCMNPETRNLMAVDYPVDLDKFNYILGTSDGKSDLLKDLNIIRDIRK